MKMLTDLKQILDEIEQENDWEHRFIQDMLILKEEGEKLKPGQFKILNNIHQKYFYNNKYRKARSLG